VAERNDAPPRLYGELAQWWPLLSPPSHYVEEADDLLSVLGHGNAPRTLLELGCGGGSLAFHLKPRFALTLADRSPQMLEQCRRVNRECETVAGDMRTLRLGRTFDVVLIHDAIMYLTNADDVQAALASAAIHCKPGGTLVLLPDCVRETFTAGTSTGGEEAADGRGLRYLDWTWDPDPDDSTFEVAYALLLREVDGTVRCELDRHTCGLFARAQWLDWLAQAGFDANVRRDRWQRDTFVATRR
jgi:SAM-dependent methyltransferase